jgi:hypothetical protein
MTRIKNKQTLRVLMVFIRVIRVIRGPTGLCFRDLVAAPPPREIRGQKFWGFEIIETVSDPDRY